MPSFAWLSFICFSRPLFSLLHPAHCQERLTVRLQERFCPQDIYLASADGRREENNIRLSLGNFASSRFCPLVKGYSSSQGGMVYTSRFQEPSPLPNPLSFRVAITTLGSAPGYCTLPQRYPTPAIPTLLLLRILRSSLKYQFMNFTDDQLN